MKTNHAYKADSQRKIHYRSQGRGRGGITRLISPSDIGQLVKPFVFLDRFDFDPTPEADIKQAMLDYYHPHSGIMTVTTLVAGKVRYEDTTPASGILPSGGIEYMIAGGGVWHTGAAIEGKRAQGFQLWVALPPELENGAAKSIYLSPSEVPAVGPVRVILGTHEGVQSTVLPSLSMNYLHVSLDRGERWSYQPPKDHDVAWLAVRTGRLETDSSILESDVVVFEGGGESIELIAHEKTDFVLGSANKRPQPLFLGPHSVHTSEEALEKGLEGIERIGEKISKIV